MNVDLATLLITALVALLAGAMLGWRLRGTRGTRHEVSPVVAADAPLIYDTLTGLYSPQVAIETLVRQLHLADRLKHAVTVLVIEVDGPAEAPVPDEVLQSVAACLLRRVRKYDVLCRWKQARFLIISPDSDVGSALVLAQDLVEGVARVPLQGAQGAVAVTVSVGVHSRRTHRPDSQPEVAPEMIAAAIRALDVSRAHGPGRIEIEP